MKTVEVKWCHACRSRAYFAKTDEEYQLQRKLGHCIAIEVEVEVPEGEQSERLMGFPIAPDTDKV
jgi:hypothetical protein